MYPVIDNFFIVYLILNTNFFFTLMAYQVFDLMIQRLFIHVKFMFKSEIPVHVS